MHGCSAVRHPLIRLKAEHAEASRQSFFLMSLLLSTREPQGFALASYPQLSYHVTVGIITDMAAKSSQTN